MASLDGKLFDSETKAMILEARRVTGLPLWPTQGSYNTSVSASGGTHSGGGAVDFSLRDYSDKDITKAVRALRLVGFAAWFRPVIPGLWGRHIHGINVTADDLSSAARNQVEAYRKGRDGLASNGPDNGPDGYRLMTWSKYKQMLAQSKSTATGDDVELSDLIGGNDYQGRPLTVAQALREAHAVFEMLREGGALNAQIDRIEADTDSAPKA